MPLLPRVGVLISVAVLLASGPLAAGHYPMKLVLESPTAIPGVDADGDPEAPRSIEYRSGWPLTLELQAKDSDLLGTFVVFQPDVGAYPESGLPGWLIFEDPDDCPYVEGMGSLMLNCPSDPDEVFLAFTPDVDFPGLEDVDGVEDIQLAMLSTRPEWGGPQLSDGVDGVGYGPNDDLPGLVILSDVGVGIVYEPVGFYTTPVFPTQTSSAANAGIQSWERADPPARWNLSGLMGSVGYELNDQHRRTTVTTSLIVPRHLFSHMVMVDQTYGATLREAYRLDAGPLVQSRFNADESSVELRAFVVNGTAPTTVEDCTGDGEVTAADADCMGYDRISNEVVLYFQQRGQRISDCDLTVEPWGGHVASFGGRNRWLVDFDDNNDGFSSTCPGGGGGTNPVPRTW